ncbi:membrane protein insertion efficiency factor YidD [Lujinxingia sediminis]|nr:membrane protein insertion efficiency factor YidD [Lujinxingia sediminis]
MYRFPTTLSPIAMLALALMLSACQSTPTARPGASEWASAGGMPAGALARASMPEGGPAGWDEAGGVATSANSGIFTTAYRLYSRHLTAVDGPRCEHRPTCSRYAYEAVQHHGFLLGSWLAVDRLMRSNSSSVLRRLPIEKIEEGSVYYRDPIEDNDFFL